MTEVIVWPAWIGGIAVGCYAVFQLFLSGRPLGVSTGFTKVCGLVSKHPFFSSKKEESMKHWRLWFIVGIPLGGLLAAYTSPGEIVASFSLGALYNSVLPGSVWLKGAVLMGGGILMGYGARRAGGCTSGHAISGIALLNAPSIVAGMGFFAGGIIAVQTLFYFFA